MTLSTVKEELEAARRSVSQAQKELAKYDGYNAPGKDHVVSVAERELETAFQRINRAMLIESGNDIEVPR